TIPFVQPTDGSSDGANQQARAAWIEAMHRSAPDVDWRLIERSNQKKIQAPSIRLRSECSTTYFANGSIKGTWKERGSSNQAGSILDVNFLPETDEIWAISDGGSLWKRSRQINNWEVIRQDLRFNRGFLKFLYRNNQPRLLAFHNNWLHYSDDRGQSWLGTNANNRVEIYNGFFAHPTISAGPQKLIAYLSKPSLQSNIQLLISQDGGSSVQNVGLFETSNFDDFKLLSIPNRDEIWVLHRSNTNELLVYLIDFNQKRLELLNYNSNIQAGDGPIEVQVKTLDQTVQLFFIQWNQAEEKAILYQSTDAGETWNEQSTLPVLPWPATFHIPQDGSNTQYIGEVDAYISKDDGKNWEIINHWWEYYQNIERYLHADMMHIESFQTSEGQPFTLIANHGGLSISYDHFASKENLGLHDLNVSQYYSVRTNPIDPDLIYAGSQDQGLQATFNLEKDSILAFDQLSPGDYGHLYFTNNGQSLWAAYPGSAVIFIEDVYQGFTEAFYELDAADETVWLAPIHPSPNGDGKVAYLAGGNPDGGEGSFLIKLTYEGSEISAQREHLDFLQASLGGTISALELSTTDTNYWYLATTNGQFFYSHDAGQSWNKSEALLTEGNYLYGQSIIASSIHPNEVYLAGSGYSNSPVFFSDDGGKSFTPRDQGLPHTLVYDLAFNDTENLLFAATEAGPFVYIIDEQRWYALNNACTPNQTYWSVEYVPGEKVVRFGTYGRGIWDLQIEALVVSNQEQSGAIIPLNLYPNPTNGLVQLNLEQAGAYLIYNLQGSPVKRGHLLAGQQGLDLSNFSAGTYFLQVQQGSKLYVGKVVLLP
ncbi:MAG: T9SS type A sorting domain-containing protein, partial [Bacteroidota bacterium]